MVSRWFGRRRRGQASLLQGVHHALQKGRYLLGKMREATLWAGAGFFDDISWSIVEVVGKEPRL